ncbi:GNAT family N-acetyltransferase [Virgisporangium aliadipatigenens]|nr:GNAT family N-acetyltransferase [Virgisporangium aliadipatigenens]
MGELIVTVATESDRAAFLSSVDGLFHEDLQIHDPYGDPEWAARGGDAYFTALLDDLDAVPLIARDGDAVLGHLVGRVMEPDVLRPGTKVASLESIRVAPPARGSGVGGRLVAAFFAWARERGAVRAGVTAYAANEGAQRFYARHGFAPSSVSLRAPL